MGLPRSGGPFVLRGKLGTSHPRKPWRVAGTCKHTGRTRMPWKLGDAPEGHPLWERQVELELQMVERGADRYRQRIAKAIDKQEMTAIRPYRRVLEDMVDAMAEGVRGWLAATARRKAGAKPMAYYKLQGLNPQVVSFVTARTVLDLASARRDGGTEGLSLLWYATRIGQEVEYEARMRAWFEREPGLFIEVQRGLDRQKATATHRRRVNINKFNKLIHIKHRWKDWTSDERIHTGLKLLEILQRTTGHIERIKDPNVKRRGKKEAPYTVVLSDELLQYLQEATENDLERTPQYLPCLMPPKPWEGVRRGGYYTPIIRLPTLIRFKADNEEARGNAISEYDSIAMPEVYTALNLVQEVPWRVNRRVLAVAHEAWERDLGIGKLGRREPLDLPIRPQGLDRQDLRGEDKRKAEQKWANTHPKQFSDWKSACAKVYGVNARRVSNTRATVDLLRIADEFANDEFYFPHMLDFRGRMYPIPAYLQPQGNDLARGLLTFAYARPLGEWGEYWLAVHLANCWGNDKVSFDERKVWVLERWDLWQSIYQNPLGNLEWTQASDPWQTLAAIFEWVRISLSEDPTKEVSALPIRVDGTCNGIQHLSAMMRDEVGGASVNLLPSEKPRDIYGESGTILHKRLEGIRDAGGKEGQWAEKWLKAFGPGGVPRGFMKGPVMVTPYGGTRDSFKGSVMKWLQDEDPKAIPDKKVKLTVADKKNPGGTRVVQVSERFAAALWIVPHLWDAVGERTGRGKECMEWLQDCARLVAESDQPVIWMTPSGFLVRHFYGALRRRRITTLVDGKRVDLVEWERTKKLAKKEQLQGIAPNFVHSLDGSVNMETILEFMRGYGHPPFTTIHDAFGTVAGEMWDLFRCIREAFVKVHQENVLGQFRLRCAGMLRDYLMATEAGWDYLRCSEEADERLPLVPRLGELNIEEVRDADYFFA